MNLLEYTFGQIRFLRLTAGQDLIMPTPAGMSLRQWKQKVQQDLKQRLLRLSGLAGLLEYDDNGKPILSNGKCISITHFEYTTALAIAPYPIGLDGELPDMRIMRIRNKFLHSEEIRNYGQGDLNILTRIWTAKEAVYKLVGRKALSFSSDIQIFHADNSEMGMALVDGEQEIHLRWIEKDAVFCLAFDKK